MGPAVYNFNIEKIDDLVWVFKGAIKDPKSFVDYFDKNKEWRPWYTFGEVSDGPNLPHLTFKNFPTPEEWEKAKNYKEIAPGEKYYFEAQIDNLFYHSTKLYKESNNIELDNWSEDGWNIAKYVPNPKDHSEYAMMYHTDFQREFSHNPDLKFAITAVFYLNDNYKGGEIVFKFLDKDDPQILRKEYSYKPSEGDILIFPSGPPHYHGVNSVTEGNKYIIRNYWRYDYPGHPLWLKLQEKYGEDVWRDLEEKRLKFNRDSNNLTFINGIPFYVEFEEYYKKEIEMLDL
jgi:hypothetical protein